METTTCELSGCGVRFERKHGRRYCCASHRAKAADIKKALELKEAYERGGELDFGALAKLGVKVGKRPKRGKVIKGRGVGHKRVLALIREWGGYMPAIDCVLPLGVPTLPSDSRRARELWEIGVLTKRGATVDDLRKRRVPADRLRRGLVIYELNKNGPALHRASP